MKGHESVSFDLGTPRAYTARKGWNRVCECGAPLGDTGYSPEELQALEEAHLRKVGQA